MAADERGGQARRGKMGGRAATFAAGLALAALMPPTAALAAVATEPEAMVSAPATSAVKAAIIVNVPHTPCRNFRLAAMR